MALSKPQSLRVQMQRFIKLTTNVYGLDKVFRLIVYTLTLVAATAAKRDAKHPLVPRLASIIAPLSDARITMRVLGTVPSLEYALAPEYNLTRLDVLQNVSMLVYHPAELVYWLGAHGIVKLPPGVADRWSRVSCMAWGVWIVADVVAAALAARRAQRALREGNHQERNAARAQIRDLRLRLVAQLADLPLAIHWSLKSYPLPQWWVGFFGLIGSVAGGVRMWRATSA